MEGDSRQILGNDALDIHIAYIVGKERNHNIEYYGIRVSTDGAYVESPCDRGTHAFRSCGVGTVEVIDSQSAGIGVEILDAHGSLPGTAESIAVGSAGDADGEIKVAGVDTLVVHHIHLDSAGGAAVEGQHAVGRLESEVYSVLGGTVHNLEGHGRIGALTSRESVVAVLGIGVDGDLQGTDILVDA